MEITQLAIFWFRCLVAFFFVLGTLFVASGIAERFLGKDSMLIRWCATIVIGLWIASAGFHVLSVFGFFRVWAGGIAIACLIGIVRLSGYSLPRLLASLQQDAGSLRTFLLSTSRPLQQSLLLILGLGALLVAARCCLLPPLSWDALTYHAVKAGMWVQSGRPWLMEAPGGWFNYRAYPGGAEIFHAWSMLPFHSDFLVSTVDFVHWLCLIPALCLLGDCIGLERRSAFIGALFCAFVPAVVFSVGSCYVDLALALALMLGVAFAAKFLLLGRTPYLVLALMSLGVAGSIKHFAYLPICAVLAILLSHIVIRHKANLRIVWSFGMALILMLSLIVPWFLYNLQLTGYPLFPFSVKVAGMQLGVSSPVTDWVLDRPGAIPYDLWLEAKALMTLFSWPWDPWHRWTNPNFGPLTLLPSCMFPLAMVALMRQQVWIGSLIIAVVAAIVGQYYLPGFSVARQLWAAANARFLWGAFMPVVLVSPLVFHSGLQRRYLDFLLPASVFHLIAGISLSWQPFEFPYLACASSLIALGAGITLFLGKRLIGLKYGLALIIVLLVCLTGLFWIRSHVRHECALKSSFVYYFPRYWVQAATSMDKLDVHRTIAVTAGPYILADNWFMYMFMGQSLQNEIVYIPVTESGAIEHFGPHATSAGPLSYESWLARIRSNGVSEVISFAPKSLELGWMSEHPESFEQIMGNGEYGLFRVSAGH